MSSSNIGFVSFAGGHLMWKFAKLRIKNQVARSQRFREISIYSENLLDKLIEPNIQNFIKSHRMGYGHWIWKPVIILDFLATNQNCDSILYLDAGCDFNYSKTSKKRWEEYLSMLDNFEAIVFQTPHLERSYTKKALVEKLQVTLPYIETGQIHAGAFFMKREFAKVFCVNWLDAMMFKSFRFLKNENDILDQFNSYIDYRYDQSIFSLMMKTTINVQILKDTDTDFSPNWENGKAFPILTSRNRSIVPVLHTGYLARGIRKIERKIIKTYNSIQESINL